MIAYLKGTIDKISENALVIEVNGVGYEVFCSLPTLSELGRTKQTVKLFIYEQIKEDAHDLYGFYQEEEKELFKKLISVSGIGPKGGMQFFNMYSSQEIIQFIMNEDNKALSKVSGIGPKTAGRMILELKDSISKMYMPDLSLLKTGLKDDGAKMEAIEALETLGYATQEAKKAVEAIYDYRASSEELIKKALSLLGM